jgi:hypothetical protein
MPLSYRSGQRGCSVAMRCRLPGKRVKPERRRGEVHFGAFSWVIRPPHRPSPRAPAWGGHVLSTCRVRVRTLRTVEGHQRLPPCAVETPSSVSIRAISPRLRPCRCSPSILWAIVGGTEGRRPAGRRGENSAEATSVCSSRNRSSSPTGIILVPQGVFTVLRAGTIRRSSVATLMPSASAACFRE